MLRLTFVATIAFTLIAAADAQADIACGERHDVLDKLAKQYKESPVGVGVASNGGVIELLTSETGTTWTLIITVPNGQSCILAAGEDWQANKPTVLSGRGI
ncbi:MAG: hypothetical protein ACM3N5_16915 [Candidatus Eiseniibacteriota bacterium]